MPRLITKTVAGLSLLFLAACGDGTRTADVAESDQETPALSASPSPTGTSSASSSTNPGGDTREPSPSPAVKAADLTLMRNFVRFALQPSAVTAGRLPFAEEVQIGLGRNLKTTLVRDDASEPTRWVFNAKAFRAYTGRFSALELIQRQAGKAHSTSIRPSGGAFEVSVGNHPHCASPPVPAPPGFGDHRRVSIQPSEGSIDTCLSWFTVDLFLNEEGNIAAVTLDVWEP